MGTSVGARTQENKKEIRYIKGLFATFSPIGDFFSIWELFLYVGVGAFCPYGGPFSFMYTGTM